MTENRRYYYLKLKEYFFNSETMMILEAAVAHSGQYFARLDFGR